MSDYCRNLVLRYPITEEEAEQLEEVLNKSKLGHHLKGGYFETCGATDNDYNYKYFLDYVVHSTYGDECGDFGKIRKLHQVEFETFAPLFKLLIPDIDMSKVKVVDYCWYNCCEPPAYYDEIGDPFYQPLKVPQAYWVNDTSKVLVTPGGDPFVICSRCGGGGHVDGIEQPNFISTCPSCGAAMRTAGVSDEA